MCNCDGSDARGNVQTPATMAGGLTRSVSASPALDKLTLDKVRDGHVKYKNLKKDQLKELCATLLGHIEDLELGIEKAKAPHNVSTTNETFELRAELKELKEAVFVDESGTNAMGDKPVGLTQAYWDTRNRRDIP
jgi:DNA-binding Xre family transcriptional regulator